VSDHEIVHVHVDSVEQHPDNPRLHDLDAIAASLARFGQTKPIVVQMSTNYVVAGNGTRLAAKRLGWDHINAIIVDFDDEKAKAYLAADNRTSDRAKYDAERLLGLLEGLEDLDGTGFDYDDVDSLMDESGANVAAREDTGDVSKVPAPTPSKPREKSEAAKGEPMRDIVMLMSVSRAAAFGEKVRKLQKHYATSSVVDTVERAIDEACDRL
jgi:ParB-like chromosome segregation protein Spo0J